MKTLLQKAKSCKVRERIKPNITDEHIELAVAWVNGELQGKQIKMALNLKSGGGSYLYYMASYLKEGIKRGKIKISLKPINNMKIAQKEKIRF